jgi:hypothetical protein
MLRKLLLLTTLASLSIICARPAIAQSLSAADILAKMEEKVGGMNEYQALLNDPDPTRSLAAMEIMLESGDPKLMRMAIEYGIYSPNPVVQRIALKGYLDTLPSINIQLSGEQAAKEQDFPSVLKNYLGGSLALENGGSFTVSLIQYDAENRCYIGRIQNSDRSQGCVVVLVDQGISIRVGDSAHGALRLTDAGELIGSMSIYAVNAPLAARIGIGF